MLGGHGVPTHGGVAAAGGAGAGAVANAPSGMGHIMGPPGHGAAGPGGMMSHGGNNGNSMGHNVVANSNANGNLSNNRAPPPIMSSNGFHSTPLGELRPNLKGINLEIIILHYVGDRRISQDNQLLTTFIAADSTGCIELVIWGEDARLLKAGDLLRVHSADTKLFKGKMQVTTSRHGKYKKFGEDILLFKENPNFSELEWVQDPNHPPGVLSPLTNQLRIDFANRGIQPVPVGQMGPQRGMGGQQGSFNPAFRQGPPRQFQGNNNPNNMPPQGGNMMGGGGVHKMGGQGFQGNNNNNNSSGNIPKNGFGFHNQGPDHPSGQDGPHSSGQHDNMPHPQHHHHPLQQPPHQGAPPPPGGHMPQHPRAHRNFHNPPGMHGNRQFNSHGPPPNSNQGGHGGGSGGDSGNPAGGGSGGGGGGRIGGGGGRPKFNKSKHRDLDAPTEAYPSPRSGLTSSSDEFTRDISKLMNQGNMGLGMFPGGGSGGGGGPGGPGHMRKKPKIESD
ncbi:Sorting nexin-30 [Actinomortierella wolfii]|nr:Sorting nexin-30 [Actinomortierella wolfii]